MLNETFSVTFKHCGPVIYVDQNESFGGLSNSLKELLENGNLLVIF